MKNKKGFTLVELIAVIVILIIIFLIAFTVADKQMESAKEGTFVKEANTFIRGAIDKSTVDRSEGLTNDDTFHGKYYGRTCYSIKDKIVNKYVSKDDNKYEGSIEVCYGIDCTYETKAWITDGTHYIDGVENFKGKSQVTGSFKSQYPYSCGEKAIGGGSSGDLLVSEFDFTGKEEIMDIILSGVYAIEAWGAQGGNFAGDNLGGFGAYVYTEVKLVKGDKLYINVGERGYDKCVANDDSLCKHAYNGGYKGTTSLGGGGGASTVTKKSGKVYEITDKRDFYVVAAGGAGAGNDGYGHSLRTRYAGAYCNYTDCYSHYTCQNGIYGANNPSGATYYGNGGGIYAPISRTDGFFAAGGLSYAFNLFNKNSSLYCYGCYVEDNNVATHRSFKTSNVSSTPTSKYAKEGNGFIKITYIENFTQN